MNDQTPAPYFTDDRLLPWPQVRPIAGISRTTAWRLQNSGDFPKPVMLSPGRVGWRESEIKAWRATRVPRGEPAPAPLFEPVCRSPSPIAEPEPLVAAPSKPQTVSRRRARRATPSTTATQLSFDF